MFRGKNQGNKETVGMMPQVKFLRNHGVPGQVQEKLN
jgi:hypothetical protein